jgi:REP element-mobilizing transposase RayT
MEMHKRKHPRLKEYDYSQNGCYFVTICTKNREQILSKINVGRDAIIPPQIALTEYGKITDNYINNICKVYNGINVEKYIIMPNHIHLLITIMQDIDGGMKASRPTVSLFTVVRSLKTMVTRQLGFSIWQTSFHEHIIRNEEEHLKIWKYIDTNHIKWEVDCYYK